MNQSIEQDVAAVSRIAAVEKILEVVCRSTGMGFSAVARVTPDRWIACAVRDNIDFGLKPGGELLISTTLCKQVRDTGAVVAIDDVRTDTVYCDHPVPQKYGFQSYISVPIRMPSGEFFGTLCAIDRKPSNVSRAETVEMCELFADLIAQHLDAHHRVTTVEKALETERKTAQFREQFMAVLGHDLRNPLAAIRTGADVLSMLPQTTETAELVDIIRRSASRMTDLIGNVLDFARGRLGGGLSIQHSHDAALAVVLKQIVSELQTAWPGRQLELDAMLDRPVSCDAQRLGQMVGNLVANALTHGDPARPVRVKATTRADWLEITVINHGKAIPPETAAQLFEPFVRGKVRGSDQGLGLGLYIASEIARAHGGTLAAVSTDEQTCFTFRMPIAADGGCARPAVARS